MSSEVIKLPYEIEKDSEYIQAFSICVSQYKEWCKWFLDTNEGVLVSLSNEEKADILNEISKEEEIIQKCIKLYTSGDIVEARNEIYELLNKLIDDDSTGFIKSDLDKNYCTRLVANYHFLHSSYNKEYIDRLLETELTFFRARTEYFKDYKEMYHIPLDKRDLVGTERFSVPGIPCLYLGCSIYDIWLELGRPPYSKFNVSSIKLKESAKKLQILNLTANPYLFMGLNSIIDGNDNREDRLSLIKSQLRMHPLVIATSIRNKNPRGKFRSDYIISHLIMLSLKKLGIDGVAYISKQIEARGEDYAIPKFVNIAIPVFEESVNNNKYGTICDNIEITKPANYEEFLSVDYGADANAEKNSFFAKVFDETGLYNVPNVMRLSGKKLDYHNTGFYRFENFVCGLRYYSLDDED